MTCINSVSSMFKEKKSTINIRITLINNRIQTTKTTQTSSYQMNIQADMKTKKAQEAKAEIDRSAVF